MRRDEAIRILRQHASTLQSQGVAHISLFGSTARDEATDGSDVDVVVETMPGPLTDLLSALLDGPVDVVDKVGFERSDQLKRKAGAELVHVF